MTPSHLMKIVVFSTKTSIISFGILQLTCLECIHSSDNNTVGFSPSPHHLQIQHEYENPKFANRTLMSNSSLRDPSQMLARKPSQPVYFLRAESPATLTPHSSQMEEVPCKPLQERERERERERLAIEMSGNAPVTSQCN